MTTLTLPSVTPPHFKIIAIGTSLGGLAALTTIVRALPPRFAVPVVVVQHRSPLTESYLVHFLQQVTVLPVHEVITPVPLVAGHIYIAAPDHHLVVTTDTEVRGVQSVRVNFSRPAIDVLFRSVADIFKESTLGVVLTGSLKDGTKGAQAIKAQGGYILAQDPTSAYAPAMPEAVIQSGVVDWIVPLDDIAETLIQLMP
jgi:two-component system chemotaxis response regulator CheB